MNDCILLGKCTVVAFVDIGLFGMSFQVDSCTYTFHDT